MMENIGNFLKAASDYGLPLHDQFNTAALFEKTNMTQVVNTLHALGRKVAKAMLIQVLLELSIFNKCSLLTVIELLPM